MRGQTSLGNPSFIFTMQQWSMRRPLPLLLALAMVAVAVAACSVNSGAVVGGANLASVMVFGRGVPDLAYSAITGKDCSVVRMEEGKSYCRPTEPAPTAPPYCTRSLGVVDCWASPDLLPAPAPRGVADGPNTLTPEQEADRTRRWPNF